MLKDITLGQYFPGQSLIHRLDARYKIIITTVFIVMLFAAESPVGLIVGGLFSIGSFMISGIPLKLVMKSLKPVIPVLAITSVLNMFFYDGETIWSFWFLEITDEGLKNAVFMIVRIVLLIIGTSLLTYTTSPIALTDAIERLFAPLKRIKLPVHELAMMMTIALRFIPTLIEETDKIISAQKARGADLESGNLIQRGRALIPILIPLIVSSFRRAEELALAMECRCYKGGEGRTRMKQLKSGAADYAALGISVLFLSIVIMLNVIL